MPTPGPPQVAPLYRRALVVFSGATDLRWLGLLKRGFRHCFVALDDGERWITVDALSHRTEVVAQALPPGFDLAGYYRAQGLVVMEALPRPVDRRAAPWELHSCVGSIKRLLGIRARRVVTPWQLYRYLAGANGQSGHRPGPQPGHPSHANFPRNILLEYGDASPMLQRAAFRLRRLRPTRHHQPGKEPPMGALFSSPKAPPLPPPQIYTPDTEGESREARLEALARRRRGRGGTVLTSERGLLRSKGKDRQPKRLLGE